MNENDISSLLCRLDARYVRRRDCSTRMEDTRMKLHNDDKRLAVIGVQMKINNWLTLAVASGIVALVIKTFM